MFLQNTIRKNADLVRTAILLHQQQCLPANSYVLDVDAISQNARMMARVAHQLGLKLFPMTKQVGRNPAIIRALQSSGVDGCVCVDMNDARQVHAAGMSVGHLGHLVQVPAAETRSALQMEPQYWTVFSLEKAKEISAHVTSNTRQRILLRVFGPEDVFYRGHEGGFPVGNIVQVARQINAMKGLEFAGITSFPTQLFDVQRQKITFTTNFKTLLTAKDALQQAGFSNIEINAPGTTSSHLFEEMAAKGVTQVEPGHGLTGTTPLHAIRDLAEKPGFLYLSEVSHLYQGRGYCFGGGMYIDPVFPPYVVKACVGKTPEEALNNLVTCDIPNPADIDYYGILEKNSRVAEGDTVVFGFRAQAFVTRAYVVPISGISRGAPKVEGIYDSFGNLTRWPF